MLFHKMFCYKCKCETEHKDLKCTICARIEDQDQMLKSMKRWNSLTPKDKIEVLRHRVEKILDKYICEEDQ